MIDSKQIEKWCKEQDITGENTFVDDGRKVQCKVRRQHDQGNLDENQHIDKFYFGDGWVYISAARPDDHRVKFDFDGVVDIEASEDQVFVETKSTTAKFD